MSSNAIAVLERQLQPLAPHFADVLPANIKPDRLIRTVMLSVERLPALLKCDRQSLFNAAMSAAVLGLEVDGVTGQAYLIPFKGKAQLVVGYKGYNTIAARAGITITGAVVRDGDQFEYELGSNAFVRHVPALNSKGRILAAWATATSASRPPVVQVMGIDDLLAVKAKSPGAQRSDSPWNDQAIGFPAMCEKTVKRRLSRALPLNMMQVAARMDEAVDEQGKAAWISNERSVVVDGEAHDVIDIEPNETPTARDLIGDRASQPTRDPSAAETAVPSGAEHAGGTADDWQEYVERWNSIIEDATDARELGATWNSAAQKNLRSEISWPTDVTPDPLKNLMERVGKKIAELKGTASA